MDNGLFAYCDGEELLSAIGNDVVDVLISLDKSKWETEIDALMENDPSLSRNEAWGKVFGSHMLEYGLSGLGGAISGGVTGAAGVGINALTGGFKKLDTSEDTLQKLNETSSIKLSQPFKKYSAEKQNTITEFLNSVDERIVSFINRIKDNKNKTERLNLDKLSEKAVADISTLVGFNVDGYTTAINSSAIRHIEQRHGANGEADSSMSKVEDIARIPYVVNNYDTVEILKDGSGNARFSDGFKNSDNSPSQMIKLSKKIDGTYYVVEAVPDSSYKKMWVISAYTKKEGITQVPDAAETAPGGTSEAKLPSLPSDSIISQKAGFDNTFSENNNESSKKEAPEPYEIIKDAKNAPAYSDYYKYADMVEKSDKLTSENILRLEELWEKRQHTPEAISDIKELAGEGKTLDEVEKSVREKYDDETITYAEIEDAYNEATTAVETTLPIEQKLKETSSIELSQPFENYSAEKQNTITEFVNSVDERIVKFVEDNKNSGKFARLNLDKLSSKAVEDISDLVGFSVDGYITAINTNATNHIETRHGENGIQDHTMSNTEDIARLTYVIDNYDSVEILTDDNGDRVLSEEFRNSDNTEAQMLRFSKKIDGTYYVVEAVPDSSYKKMWVVSAYTSKKGVTQESNAANATLNTTPKAHLASPPNNSISQKSDSDNTFSENNNKNATNEGDNSYESEHNESKFREKEARDDISDGSGKRNARESSREPSGELGQSTKGWKNILEGADSADEIGRARTAATLRTEHISSSSLGIANGTDTPRLRIYPEEKWDDNLKNIQSVLKKETGKEVIFVQGPIEIRTKTGIRNVRGVNMENKIIIRMNDLKVHPENIAFHELYHERAAESPRLNEAIKEAIIERFSEEEFNEVLEVYADKLAGVYEFDEHSDEEYNAVLDAILEEIFADAYANINGFGVHPEKFRETVVKITEAENKRVQSLKKKDATMKKKVDYSVDDTNYLSYQSLISKPDMILSKLVTPDSYGESQKPPRIEVVKAALANARMKNSPKNTKENVFIRNNDTGNDILINRRGIEHGLYRNYEKNAIAYANIGDIIENSILINEHSAREGGDEGNIYLGAGWYGNELYLCRIITNKNNSVEDLEVMYALNTKKESVAHNRLGIANKSLSNTNSTISIADFLDIVKYHYADVLPNDVLRQMSMVRPSSPISDFVKYSFSDVPIPTYEELIAKDDMEIVDLTNSYGKGRFKEQRADFIKSDEAKALLSEPVLNKDTGEKIFIVNSTFTHSFSNDKLGAEQIAAVKNIRKIIENAVLTHAEAPTHGNESTTGVYTLFAAVKTKTGVKPTRLKVKEYMLDGNRLPQNIQQYFDIFGDNNPYASLYDNRVLVLEDDGMDTAETKKEEPSSSAVPRNSKSAVTGDYPSGSSVISIADLLSLVNSEYQKYIPKKRNGSIQKYSLDDNIREDLLDKYTPAKYNKWGWAIVNNVIHGRMSSDFYSKLAELKKLGHHYNQLPDGTYIIPTGAKEGIDNVLIFTNGNFKNPSIERVVKINLDNETDLAPRRYDFIEFLKEGYDYDAIVTAWTDDAGQKLFNSYTLQDFDSLITLRQQNKIASKSYLNSRGSEDGDGSPGEGKRNTVLSPKTKYSYSYHTYDITKKTRDTADRINGLERPKPNEGYAQRNDISIDSISQNADFDNTFSENNNESAKKEYPEPYEIILDAEKAPTYSTYYKYAEQVAKSGELTAENILRLEELWEKRQHTPEALSQIKELAGEGKTLDEVEKTVRENYDDETITYAEIEDAYNEVVESKTADKEYISMEDFANSESAVWHNVDYSDDTTKSNIMQEVHNNMVSSGSVVNVSDSTLQNVGEAYPDLRGLKILTPISWYSPPFRATIIPSQKSQ